MTSLPRLILASTSPRRIEMLSQMQMTFESLAPATDETPKRGEDPKRMVKRLSREKAESVAARVSGGGAVLVIAADTIVVAPGGKRVLGKPKDRAEALRMLKLLAGKTHLVHTGYCLLWAESGVNHELCRVVTSKVTMRSMTKSDIERYVETGESMDKAGAYAAQGFGASLIEAIQGSYMNVVGLPLSHVLSDLENEFDIPLFSWRRGKR